MSQKLFYDIGLHLINNVRKIAPSFATTTHGGSRKRYIVRHCTHSERDTSPSIKISK